MDWVEHHSRFWFAGDSETKQNSEEILKTARRAYYEADATLRRLQAIVAAHPKRYVWEDMIPPEAFYNVQQTRAKYEAALHLHKMLEAKRAEKTPGAMLKNIEKGLETGEGRG